MAYFYIFENKSAERVYTRGQYSKSANSNCEFVVLPFKLDSLDFRRWKCMLESGNRSKRSRLSRIVFTIYIDKRNRS